MEITYASICDKLGFDIESHQCPHTDHEDDTLPNPYSVLTDEESDFLAEYFMNRRKSEKKS